MQKNRDGTRLNDLRTEPQNRLIRMRIVLSILAHSVLVGPLIAYGRFAGLTVNFGSRTTTSPSTSSIFLMIAPSSFTPAAFTLSRTCSGLEAPTIADDTL